MAGYRILGLLLFAPLLAAGQNSITFGFNITGQQDATTSAAVLDSTGNMVKTLWGNRSYPPGSYTATWDGTLDNSTWIATATGSTTNGSNILTLTAANGAIAPGQIISCTVRVPFGTTVVSVAGTQVTMSAPATGTQSGLSMYFLAPIAATTGANYTIKLLTNNVSYAYDGHLGTTDLDWYGTHKYSQVCGWQRGFAKIAFAGNRGWVACEYNEGLNMIMWFDRSNPGYPSQANVSYKTAPGSILHESDDLATDGQTVYLMERSVTGGSNNNFITAVDSGTGAPVYFSQGTMNSSFIWYNPPLPASYIDLWTISQNNPGTGIAVQRNSATCVYPSCGNILAVAHALTNTILLFDKVTGASLGTISGVVGNSSRTTQLAFTNEGLWFQGGDNNLYLITGLPSSPVISQPITGLQYVAGIGANGNNNVLYVADGGTHQQIYGYAPNTHALVRTYGTLGGYNDCNPTVTHNRLQLDDTATFGVNHNTTMNALVFVAADDSDNLWIQDLDGRRVQHIDNNNNYVNQILYRRPSYIVTVSETMPTRVFIGMLEYAIDYTKPLVPGDGDPAVGGSGAWVLTKDWMICSMGASGSPSTISDLYYFLAVEQFPNGRVYANPSYNLGSPTRYIYELPTNGTSPARSTGVLALGGMLTRNGNFTHYSSTGSIPTRTANFDVATLTGYDSSANPIYTALTTVASVPTNTSNTLLIPTTGSMGGLVFGGEQSTGGYYPVFQTSPQVVPRYPHAAGFLSGASAYNWQTMPEVCPPSTAANNIRGEFPCIVAYNSSNYSANATIHTEGKNFFFGYLGNYAQFGAQFYHYWEDGLMVGQFGNNQAFPRAFSNDPIAPGTFGNSSFFSTTSYNGDVYLYTGDEAYAPAHRWHISNLSSIHEWAGTGALQPNGQVTLTQLF